MRQALEFIAGVSGIFLFVAYISGRIYLQAYYNVFHVPLQDLDLSIQDVMFASWRSLLPAGLTALVFAALTPWLRSVEEREQRVRADMQTLSRFLDEVKLRYDARGEKIAELKNRIEAGEDSEEFREELRALEAESDDLEKEIAALVELTQSVSTAEEARGAVERAFDLLGVIPRPLALLIFATIVMAGPVLFALLSLDQGWKTALLDGGEFGSVAVGLAVAAVVLPALLLAKQQMSPPLMLGIGLLLIYTILLLPLLSGSLTAHADRNSTDAGRGLPRAVLVSGQQLASNWVPQDDAFVSPELRLAGRNPEFFIMWDPAEPNEALYFPVGEITRLERK